MDLSQLGESAQYMVPLIILFCMCIGYVIKTSLDFIENKYIPYDYGKHRNRFKYMDK